MNTIARARIIVSGMVQGVSYRAYAVDEARQLGLKGWVRNLPDGRVEAVAEGSREKIEAFEKWCRRGSPASRVTNVSVELETPTGEFADFKITRG